MNDQRIEVSVSYLVTSTAVCVCFVYKCGAQVYLCGVLSATEEQSDLVFEEMFGFVC
jgi:hypothetical protein